MTATEIYARLRELAPSVSFRASRDRDDNYAWDGDTPDPSEEGFDCYNVLVVAEAVVCGSLLTGIAYLGGCFMKEEEQIDDIDGYLPQELEEASEALEEQIENKFHPVVAELSSALSFLRTEMRDRWELQQKTGV